MHVVRMDCAINAPIHGNIVVDWLNATDKCYVKGEIEVIGKLASVDTLNIGILTSASKDLPIKFADQFLCIINNK